MKYARSNGLLPVQHKINARVKKAMKDLGVNGWTVIRIPWSDFVFSNLDPWPKQFKEGLENYCRLMSTASDPDEVFDPTDLYQLDPKDWEFDASSNFDLTRLTPRDVAIIFESTGVSRFTKIWSVRQNKEIEFQQVPVIYNMINRVADCDGVDIILRYIDLTRPENRHRLGFKKWEDGTLTRDSKIFLFSHPKDLTTYPHEIMHIVQDLADNLLLARKYPELAFIGPVQETVYGQQPKSLRADSPNYLEFPKEFYPNAYSAAADAVSKVKSSKGYKFRALPLVDRVILAKFGKLSELRSTEQRNAFLNAAYHYAVEMTGERVDPEAIRRIYDAARLEPALMGRLTYLYTQAKRKPDNLHHHAREFVVLTRSYEDEAKLRSYLTSFYGGAEFADKDEPIEFYVNALIPAYKEVSRLKTQVEKKFNTKIKNLFSPAALTLLCLAQEPFQKLLLSHMLTGNFNELDENEELKKRLQEFCKTNKIRRSDFT